MLLGLAMNLVLIFQDMLHHLLIINYLPHIQSTFTIIIIIISNPPQYNTHSQQPPAHSRLKAKKDWK